MVKIKTFLKTQILLFLALLMCVTKVLPAEVNDIYQASVSVPDRSEVSREGAITKALNAVLIKASGNQNITTIPKIKKALETNPPKAVRYGYHSKMKGTDESLMLQFTFVPEQVNELIASANQGIWPKKRPLLVFWVIIKIHGEYKLLDTEQDILISNIIKETAKSRGLPFVLPELDMESLGVLSVEDIIYEDNLILMQFSKRYQGEGIVKCLIDLNDKVLSGSFELTYNNETLRWRVTGSTSNEIIEKGIGHITEALSSRYAVLNAQDFNSQLKLTVNNIKNLKDYQKVVSYFQKLAVVSSAQVIQASGTTLTFKVIVNGGKDAFLDVVSVDKILISKVDDTDEISNNLTFQLKS